MIPFGDIRDMQIAGEDGFILYASGKTLSDKNAAIQDLVSGIAGQKFEWLIEVIPSYDSVMLVFDMYQVDHHVVYQALRSLKKGNTALASRGKHHILPVWYGAPEANDLQTVANVTGLSESDIIHIHSSNTYRAFAVGFAPGFAYLGELDPALSVPRMSQPRTKVPAGAVAIADRQTAVYPNESPGGWHLLGLCPVPLYVPSDGAKVLINAGDTVSFKPIDQSTFEQLATQYGLHREGGKS